MKQIVEIDLPSELLIGLHTNAEGFSKFLKEQAAISLFKDGKISSGIASNWLKVSRIVKEQAAISLFKDGKISSGIASNWLKVSRIDFLRVATDAGASLLQDSSDDYRRETSLL